MTKKEKAEFAKTMGVKLIKARDRAYRLYLSALDSVEQYEEMHKRYRKILRR